FDCLPDERARIVKAKRPIMRTGLGVSVGHASECQTRDFQAAFTEIYVIHLSYNLSLLRWNSSSGHAQPCSVINGGMDVASGHGVTNTEQLESPVLVTP